MIALLTILGLLSLSCSTVEGGKEPSHPCDRKCSPFSFGKTCYFKFKLESRMTDPLGCTKCIKTDGRRTLSYVINSQLPGPAIATCIEDTIIVDVTNELLKPADIHWHGIQQVGTPWMDGTQYVTQYPIKPSETFRYKFAADTCGTFFYHSHFADQKALGVFGSLIVRRLWDPSQHLYDVDSRVMFLNDWFYDGSIYKTHNILINGLGQEQKGSQKSLFSEFNVKKGLRYRFRVIYSSNTNCTIEISVDSHSLIVISSDGFAFKPVKAESIGITSGERFDFIINANKQVGIYWIRVRGNYACGGMVQGGVLRYEGSTGSPNVSLLNDSYDLRGVQVNSTVIDRNKKDVAIHQLQSLDPWNPSSLYPTYYMNVTMRDKGEGKFDFLINEIYHQSLKNFSLLQDKDIIPYSEHYCSASKFEKQGIDCTQTTCKCPHLIDIPCKKYVEIFFFNPTHDVHPMHFHGYDLRVVGFGKLPSSITNINQVCMKLSYKILQ